VSRNCPFFRRKEWAFSFEAKMARYRSLISIKVFLTASYGGLVLNIKKDSLALF